MQLKKLSTCFVLALAITIPSTSSAMTSDQENNSLETLSEVLDVAQSIVKTFISGEVTLRPLTSATAPSYDANKDGKVNYGDVTYVYEAVTNSSSDTSGADVNNDGKIDKADFLSLRAYFKSIGDYVSAYDMPTIGAGWTVVPADGKIDQKDVDAVKFLWYIEAKDASHYNVFGDLNADGKVNNSDFDILEKYISGSTEEVVEATPAAEEIAITGFSPEQNNQGVETVLKINGTGLGGALAVILIEDKTAISHIFETLKGDDSQISFVVPSNLPVGNYAVHILIDNEMITTDGQYKVISTTPVQAPVVTVSFPSGKLPEGTKSTYLLMKTNVAAQCSYSSTPGTTYELMKPFTFNGLGTDRNGFGTQVSNLPQNEQVNYYVKCKTIDEKGAQVMVNDHVISFTVGEIS